MPLVRISLMQGKPAGFGRKIGEVKKENWSFGKGIAQYAE